MTAQIICGDSAEVLTCKCGIGFKAGKRRIYCSRRCRGKAGQQRSRDRRKAGVPILKKSTAWTKAVVASKARVIRATYSQFVRDRNHRFKFTLTVRQFGSLVFRKCHYCGADPSVKTKSGRLLRNGIDRVDPRIGYVLKNCVPCCWQCNRMKWNWSTAEFSAHINRIHAHSKL